MFIGLERTLALGHPEAVNVFTQQLLELHRGQVEILRSDFFKEQNIQGMEIYWRDNFLCPTEEEYRLMISRKTGKKNDDVVENETGACKNKIICWNRRPVQFGCEVNATILIFRSKLHRADKVALAYNWGLCWPWNYCSGCLGFTSRSEMTMPTCAFPAMQWTNLLLKIWLRVSLNLNRKQQRSENILLQENLASQSCTVFRAVASQMTGYDGILLMMRVGEEVIL